MFPITRNFFSEHNSFTLKGYIINLGNALMMLEEAHERLTNPDISIREKMAFVGAEHLAAQSITETTKTLWNNPEPVFARERVEFENLIALLKFFICFVDPKDERFLRSSVAFNNALGQLAFLSREYMNQTDDDFLILDKMDRDGYVHEEEVSNGN